MCALVGASSAFDSFEVSFDAGPLGLAFGLRAGEPYEGAASSDHDTSQQAPGTVALSTSLLAGRVVVHQVAAQARAKGVQPGDIIAAVGAIEYFDPARDAGSSSSAGEGRRRKPRPTQHDASQATLSEDISRRSGPY